MFLATIGAHHLGILFRQFVQKGGKRLVTVRAQNIRCLIAHVCQSPAKLERETGIEPVTSSLGSWRSTAELLPLSRT